MVPTGTFSTTSAPSCPVRFDPSPCRPRSALYSGLNRKCTRVLCRSLDSMMTSPPLPPSPPDGPPRGTNFSRRNAMQPLPPSPAFTRILASSMNIGVDLNQKASSQRRGYVARTCVARALLPAKARTLGQSSGQAGDFALLRFDRLNHHELAHRTLVQKFDVARDLGKQRVVFSAAHVQPRFHTGPALPDNDGAARHDLPAESIKPQPL